MRRFEADFDCRFFRDEGEIYHVIGLSLWLSELGFPSWEDAVVMEKVKRYITEIYNGAASPDEIGTSTLVYDMGGAFGLCYMNVQDPRFRELASFHAQQRAAWQERAYPAIAADLHQLMTANSEAFLRNVCFTDGGAARFARLGVLKHISADQFAVTVANAPYRCQKNVMMALSIQYEQVGAEHELEREVPWLKDVQRHLHTLGENLPRIARFHLSRLAKEYVDKTVAEVDARLCAKYRSSAGPGGEPEHGAD